ncbi:MAG: Calx-beta domain-containing protein [Verrucomicrobiales bacterium]
MALLSGSWADADGGELVLGRFADAYLEPIDGELAYVEIPVILTEPTEVPATVLYRIVMETAALGADFDVRDVQDGLLTFAPGATLANISVTLIGDSIVEPLESFRVELFEARGATIARASVNYWIRDRQWRAPRIFASATSADEGDPMEFEVGGSGLDPAQIRQCSLHTFQIKFCNCKFSHIANSGSCYIIFFHIESFERSELKSNKTSYAVVIFESSTNSTPDNLMTLMNPFAFFCF